MIFLIQIKDHRLSKTLKKNKKTSVKIQINSFKFSKMVQKKREEIMFLLSILLLLYVYLFSDDYVSLLLFLLFMFRLDYLL